MKRFIGALAFCLIALPASAQDTASIQKLNDAFEAAFARGDAVALAGMYTEDASLLPPGAEMIRGRAAIQAFWGEAMKDVASAKLMTLKLFMFKLASIGAAPLRGSEFVSDEAMSSSGGLCCDARIVCPVTAR